MRLRTFHGSIVWVIAVKPTSESACAGGVQGVLEQHDGGGQSTVDANATSAQVERLRLEAQPRPHRATPHRTHLHHDDHSV
jgi:hypothetical protein